MHKFIVFVAAAIAFWWFASHVFEETFGEDRERAELRQQ